MTSLDFLSALKSVKDQSSSLIFHMADGAVAPGYHVTEVKSAQVHSMDCGGQRTSWHETTLQLWSPSKSSEGYMNVGKFLSIYNRVSSSLPLTDISQMRVEYGEPGQAALSYLVTTIHQTDAGIKVQLVAPGVTCKGADRSVGNVLNVLPRACCEPSQAKESSCCD